MTGRDLARQLLDEERYANLASRHLARILYSHHPDIFNTLNSALCAVRTVRGACGRAHRRWNTDTHKRELGKPGDGQDTFPESTYEELPRYILRGKRILIMNDIHVPCHDKSALDIAIKDALDFGVNAVLINGDYYDFHRISVFQPERTSPEIYQELITGREGLVYLRKKFKRCNLVFKMGNHDERWARFLYRKAQELWKIPELEFDHIAHISENGFSLVPERAIVMAGKLPILHGHEILKSRNFVSASRGLFLKAKTNAAIGHLHTSDHYSRPNLDGKLVSCWGIGCLCGLHPLWFPYGVEWGHGYALMEVDGNGDFEMYNKRIVNGRAFQ